MRNATTRSLAEYEVRYRAEQPGGPGMDHEKDSMTSDRNALARPLVARARHLPGDHRSLKCDRRRSTRSSMWVIPTTTTA